MPCTMQIIFIFEYIIPIRNRSRTSRDLNFIIHVFVVGVSFKFINLAWQIE